MTFLSVRQIASERLNEALIYLNHITELEPRPLNNEDGGAILPASLVVPVHVNVMKGLFIVQLYGALEKSMSDAMQMLLSKIIELKPKNEHVILHFNVITMARKWKAIKDTRYDKAFTQMTDFFSSFVSNEYLGMDETLFSTLLQNVWAKTLDEVTGCLGIESFMTLRDSALVNELVGNRNAVAHGRESAATIGQRYKASDLRSRLQSVQSLIVKTIDRLEKYFNEREFLQQNFASLYSAN